MINPYMDLVNRIAKYVDACIPALKRHCLEVHLDFRQGIAEDYCSGLYVKVNDPLDTESDPKSTSIRFKVRFGSESACRQTQVEVRSMGFTSAILIPHVEMCRCDGEDLSVKVGFYTLYFRVPLAYQVPQDMGG